MSVSKRLLDMLLVVFILVCDAPAVLRVKIVVVVVLAVLVPGWVSQQDPGDFNAVLWYWYCGIGIVVFYHHHHQNHHLEKQNSHLEHLNVDHKHELSYQHKDELLYQHKADHISIKMATTCGPHSATQ